MNNEPDSNTYTNCQASREQDYLTSGAFQDKDDAGSLHIFFSPLMVPIGMTDDEVRICIKLHSRRKKLEECITKKLRHGQQNKYQSAFDNDYFLLEKYQELLGKIFGEAAYSVGAENMSELLSCVDTITNSPIALPTELRQSPMTRESFACGVAVLTSKMDALEKEIT